LARACDWQSQGQGFDSPYLHKHTVQINAKSCKLNIYRVFCFNLLCNKVPFDAYLWVPNREFFPSLNLIPDLEPNALFCSILHFDLDVTQGSFAKILNSSIMGRKTFSIMFMIRRGQLLKNQEAPVYMRITVDGERVEISTKRSVNPDHWNDTRGSVKSGTPFAKELNYFLEQIRHKVYEHQQDLINRNKIVSAISLKDAFLHEGDNDNKTVLQVYTDHNEDLKKRIDKGISKLTYIRHVSSKNNLERFIKAEYNKSDYYLKNVDHIFLLKYGTFLRTCRNCNNNSTVKYIRNFGKIIKLALDNDWIKVDPMRKLKLRLEEVDRPFLSESELNTIMNKIFTIQRVAQVRDVFVFCCFTGLAFVDVKSFNLKDIVHHPDGSLWINKQRHKSKQWAHIPLLPVAKQILDRYSKNPDCIRKGLLLPVLSNQKMNAYLKEIADLCGINRNLTTHCARHTFGTTVTLANGISMESTSKMLGHSSLAMTKRYARILDSTIGQEMNQLAQKLQFYMN